MPLALLLHQAFGKWHHYVNRLSGWEKLVDLEDTLLRRARGVFLSRWFGSGLPMSIGALRVAIANIDELRKHYQELYAQAKRNSSDLNLLEPVAGITGTLIGSLLSPTSSMVLMAVISEEMPNWFTTLAAALNWLTYGSLGVLLFAVGVPIAAFAVPALAIAHRDELGPIHRFLGALAGLFAATRRLLEQLIGKRSDVRNPLLAQLLGVLDRLAELVPFVFTLAALVILWAGPKLSPLARQLDILIPLARQVFGIIGDVVTNLLQNLVDLYTGPRSPWAILQSIIATLRLWFQGLTQDFMKLFAIAAPAFVSVPVPGSKPPAKSTRAWLEIKTVLGGALDKLLQTMKSLTSESWLVKRIKEIGARLGKMLDIFTSIKTPKKPPTKGPSWAEENLPPYPAGLEFPKTPAIPDLISAGEVFAREEWLSTLDFAQPDTVAWSQREVPREGFLFVPVPGDEKTLAKLRQSPPDVFAAERRALLKKTTADSLLAEAQAREGALRGALFAVIDNLLGPAAAAEMPKLQGLLWELDDAIYGKKAEFPVRDVPGGDRLTVRVTRLRVRAEGMKDGVVRAWSRDLQTALKGQIYRTEGAVPA